MLRDSVNLYNNHYGLPCFSCKKFDHQAAHCTLYNLRLDRELVNFRHKYCPQQIRDPEGRKSLRRKNIIQSLSQKQKYSLSLKRLRLYYVQELYGFSEDESNDEEVSLCQSSEYQDVKLVERSKDISQKPSLDDKIAFYKTDKDYFKNVQQIRQKDLQQYFICLGQTDNYLLDNNILDISNSTSEQESEFEEDEFDEKFNQSNSLSTPQKDSSLSSFQLFSNQKQEKNHPFHNSMQIQFQSSKDIYQNTSLNKLGQESNSDIKVKSNINNSQTPEQQTVSNNIISEFQRPSFYKQFSHLRGSAFSGNTNNQESDFQISQNNLTQKIQSSQSSLHFNEEEKNFVEIQENQVLRRKTKLLKQSSNDIKDYDIDSIINTQQQATKSHLQNNKKNVGLTTEQKKKMTLTLSRRKSVNIKADYESSKNTNAQPISTVYELTNQPVSALKQKFSTRFTHQLNQIDFPGKHFDIFDQFDKIKDFIYYFPAFNSTIVLKEQRKKAYQQLVLMRFNKLQVVSKSINFGSDQEKQCQLLNQSPKKLGVHQQQKHHHPKKQ